MNKFVEIPKNDVRFKIENAWFEACREKKVPFITIKSKTKFANVHWDYITYPTEIDKVLDGLENQLRDGAVEIFMRYADKRSKCATTGYLVWYKNLEIPKARLAAVELYDLIVGYVDGANKSGRA